MPILLLLYALFINGARNLFGIVLESSSSALIPKLLLYSLEYLAEQTCESCGYYVIAEKATDNILGETGAF